MNDFELNRVKWARECLRKFTTNEEAKKVDYGFVVCATEWLQEILNVAKSRPKFAEKLEDAPSMLARKAEIWTPKPGDRVKVVNLAPLEETRRRLASRVLNETTSPLPRLWDVAHLKLGDEGIVKRGITGVDQLFYVDFECIGSVVLCGREMVCPIKDRTMRLAFLRLEAPVLLGSTSGAIVWDDAIDVGYNVQGRTNEEILNRLADRMGWRSLSYIDVDHEFPVTEVRRE